MLSHSLVPMLALFVLPWLSASCRMQGEASAKSAPRTVSDPIVYFEVAGPDGKKLGEFFSTVFGWSIGPGSTIAASSTGGLRGGIRQDPPEKVLYIGVRDVTAKLAEIEKAGGKVVIPRTVVPGVVTFALFLDPAGNRLGLAELGSFPK